VFLELLSAKYRLRQAWLVLAMQAFTIKGIQPARMAMVRNHCSKHVLIRDVGLVARGEIVAGQLMVRSFWGGKSEVHVFRNCRPCQGMRHSQTALHCDNVRRMMGEGGIASKGPSMLGRYQLTARLENSL
jgi:hypothetical protein